MRSWIIFQPDGFQIIKLPDDQWIGSEADFRKEAKASKKRGLEKELESLRMETIGPQAEEEKEIAGKIGVRDYDAGYRVGWNNAVFENNQAINKRLGKEENEKRTYTKTQQDCS